MNPYPWHYRCKQCDGIVIPKDGCGKVMTHHTKSHRGVAEFIREDHESESCSDCEEAVNAD